MRNPIINELGDKFWYKEGNLHREDGPAIEYINGDKEWWQNNEHHRLDGPANDYISGFKTWYQSIKKINYID